VSGERRLEMAVPHDLQIALHDDPAAEAAFEKLPYSHQREYIDWILEARLLRTCSAPADALPPLDARQGCAARARVPLALRL